MFSTLRKIRKSLIESGSARKYVLYSIGEIALVVIGILIALQINNWNEGRKELNLELNILSGLSSDLKNNKIKIQEMIKQDSSVIVGNRIVLKILAEKNSNFHDSLAVYFGRMNRYNVFYPQRMSYETLKSTGLNTVKNDTLRSKIIGLHDETYVINLHVHDLKKEMYVNTNGLINKRFYTPLEAGYKIPNDFEALKNDMEFLNAISDITAEKDNFLNHSRNILMKTIEVKNEVDKEIKSINRN